MSRFIGAAQVSCDSNNSNACLPEIKSVGIKSGNIDMHIHYLNKIKNKGNSPPPPPPPPPKKKKGIYEEQGSPLVEPGTSQTLKTENFATVVKAANYCYKDLVSYLKTDLQ